MNYQQFIVVLKDKVTQLLGDSMSVHTQHVLKNNGKTRIGLTITNEHINISPTIYLEEYYQQFLNGTSIQDIAERILDVYHEVKVEEAWQIHSIKNFEVMRPKIVYKLIHAKKNETLLETIPYVAYLDFAIVFYILFEVDQFGTASIPITYNLLRLWNVSFDEIQQNAFANTPILLPASFKPMKLVINEMLGIDSEESDDSEELMYVLTNSLKSFGAACILYEGLLETIGKELGEDYYILPSSIHETIIVADSNSPCKEHLLEMVSEINQTQVDEEEVLSDRVYHYNRDKRLLS